MAVAWGGWEKSRFFNEAGRSRHVFQVVSRGEASMNTRKALLPLVVAGACSVAAIGTASATTIDYAFPTVLSFDFSITATWNSTVYDVTPGQISLDDANFNVLATAWCYDVTMSVLDNGTYHVAPGTIDGKVGALVYHGDAALAGADPSLPAVQQESEAFQLAMWDILFPGITYAGVSSAVSLLEATYVSNVDG